MAWSIGDAVGDLGSLRALLHVLRAAGRQLGATGKEMGEMLAVASTMGGCVGEMWALKAFKAYKEFVSAQAAPEVEPSCCQ
nr:hypothetical protein [uncultured Pseudogulbenkiania sp.]